MRRLIPLLLLGLSSCCMAESTWYAIGEHLISKTDIDDQSETFDLHKLYVGGQYRLDSDWQVNFDLSLEQGWNDYYPGDGLHTDNTDVILESLNVTWQYAHHHRLTAGRFYLPIGTLNKPAGQFESMGAARNPVEIHIIPTNWVETGLMLSGAITDQLDYDFSIHSALVMDDAGLVRDGRDRDSFSVSKAHAFTARLHYRPWDALEWFTSFHFEVDTTGWDGWGNNSAGLIQTHLRYQANRMRHTFFYAYWDIDGIRFETSGREKQNGWYLESTYQLNDSVTGFVRINEWDNAQDNRIESRIRQIDIGANYQWNADLVLKMDYAKLTNAVDGNALNLGISWRL